MEKLKFVSWACITYGRPQCVPEIIRMFLEQDYKGKKEFVILNDDPDVNYVFNHPEVRIYNWNHRFNNVRLKNNACVDLCKGEVFMETADDDSWKPHATTMFMDALGDSPFVIVRGFWKHSEGLERVWLDMVTGPIFACRVDFFQKMKGYAAWIWHDFGDHIRDKSTDDWVLHPANFVERVKEAEGCYKEFRVEEKDGFFTWVRGQPSFWTDRSPEKYKIKKRNPKIIEVKL